MLIFKNFVDRPEFSSREVLYFFRIQIGDRKGTSRRVVGTEEPIMIQMRQRRHEVQELANRVTGLTYQVFVANSKNPLATL